MTYLRRIEEIVRRHGKTLTGWADIGAATVPRGAIAQYWQPAKGSEEGTATARAAVRQGARLVMSPADHAYLDMKYTASTPLGQDWAGLVEVRDAYAWDPGTLIDGVTDKDVAGVEAPLWTETIVSDHDIDYMTLPRLPAIAEIGWTPQKGRSWSDFRLRLAADGRCSAARTTLHPRCPGPRPETARDPDSLGRSLFTAEIRQGL